MWIAIGIIAGVALILLLCVLAAKYGSYARWKQKGEEGERIVEKILGGLDGEKYTINDLRFSENGQPRQIDHVCVRHNGIWVIETKNRSGIIVGDGDKRIWVQTFPNSVTRNEMRNPVMQNKTHLYALSVCLGLPRRLFRNLVVFADTDADISGVTAPEVCRADELRAVIDEPTGVRLSSAEMKRYADKIRALGESSSVGRREQKRDIAGRRRRIKRGICPRCGSPLVAEKTDDGIYYVCPASSCGFRIAKRDRDKMS